MTSQNRMWRRVETLKAKISDNEILFCSLTNIITMFSKNLKLD